VDNNLETTIETGTGWRDYYELTKPRVVMLIVFTAVVGMFLSVPGWPGASALMFGTLGIGLASSAAAVFNHVLDARIDIQMMRTRGRPLPQGKLTEKKALVFASVLCVVSMIMLVFLVNPGEHSDSSTYVYFADWLRGRLHRLAQACDTAKHSDRRSRRRCASYPRLDDGIDAGALLLFLIVFVWTPPHFWALAIARKEEYAKVDIPMLPVTHGEAYTRLNILLYSILLVLVTILPYLISMSGVIYLATALILDVIFLNYAIQMYRKPEDEGLPMKMFKFSIAYLGYLFAALLVDHYLLFQISL
jgi:protoheme IX farnesyltransferase